MDILYRYYDWQTVGLDEWGDAYGPSTTNVGLQSFHVVRTTPKGAWIHYGGSEKFVRLEARKRFACPTKEEALVSFMARKRKQARILQKQLNIAETALRIAELMKDKPLDFSRENIYTSTFLLT